ncbi:MAG: hypothetical protein PF638_03245 [Candidatus Delongbacteria bacterium]|jgi:hypothetical protein|nr:hypothetical protein [Candidatus Delongbacteria bacterium]
MELKVIRHKTSKEFFEGFYPEAQVGSYAYQLERMFEQGSAVEGDLFVVTDKEEPLISLEIYRNNTRRILEKMPILAIGIQVNSKEYVEALALIFDHLSEDMIYGDIQKKLEIAIIENYEFYNELKAVIDKFGYKTIIKTINYAVDPEENYDMEVEDHNSKKFIDYPVDDRFDLLSDSINHALINDLSSEKLYLDLLEEGYQSEELWEVILYNGKMLGYILPVFKNGLKNSIEMIDYGLKSSDDIFQKITINRLVEIAKDNDVEDLTINVNDSDTCFVNLAKELKLTKNHITEKFLKV